LTISVGLCTSTQHFINNPLKNTSGYLGDTSLERSKLIGLIQFELEMY